jgi:predicted nucleotidyltransferase
VFQLDRARVLGAFTERARSLLAAREDVLEVRLFGSLARDGAAPGSDADVWVLLTDGAPPFLERSADLARSFEGTGIGCDVLAYTESEWEELRCERRRIVEVVESEAILLASRRRS